MFSLCLALVLIVFTTYVHGIVHRYGPTDTLAREGDTVTLHCAFNNKAPEDEVFWYRAGIGHVLSKNSHIFGSAESERYMITGNHSNGEFNLQISDVRKSDADEYHCGFDKEPQHDYLGSRLDVLVPPSIRYPACIPLTERSKVGQKTRLTCVSNGGDPPAMLTWQRNGDKITEPKEQRNELSYLMEAKDVGATFTCIAESPALTVLRSCSLIPLNELPSITVLPRVMYTKIGESAIFRCQKQNQQPHDSYSWYFNDKHILPDERFHLSSDRKTLTIDGIVASDNDAEIICKVYNSTDIIEGATATISISDLSTSTNPPNKIATLTGRGGNLHYLPPSNDNSKTALIAVSIIGGIAIAMLACIIYIYLQKKIHRKQTVIPMTPRRRNSSRAFSIRSLSARSFSIRSFSGRSFLLRRNSANPWRRNASVPNASVGSYVALNIANRRNDKYEDLRSVASCPSFSLNGQPLSRSMSAFALPLPPVNPCSSSPLSFRAPSHISACSDNYMHMHNSIASVTISEDDREDAESCDTYEIIDDKMLKQLIPERTDTYHLEVDADDADETASNYTNCNVGLEDNGSIADLEDNGGNADLDDNGTTLQDSKTSTVGSKSSIDYLEILP